MTRTFAALIALSFAAPAFADGHAGPGDAAEGEKTFNKCKSCHMIVADDGTEIVKGGRTGPNLYGIMGKPIGGGAPGFAYSSALADKGGQWDWNNMSEWLKSPRGFANGTKMSFAGLSKIEDRAAVMLFMNTYGSNLPVPEFVAEVADGADAPGAGPGPVEGAEAGAVEAAGAMSADQPVAEN